MQFFAGAALGLGLHESGHIVLDEAFGAHPGVRKVSAGFIPFFAITHEPVSPLKEFTISSAGFWVQHAGSEILLMRRPNLRDEHAAFVKGLLAFVRKELSFLPQADLDWILGGTARGLFLSRREAAATA